MGALLRKYAVAAQIDGIVLITLGSMNYKANPTLAAGDVTISKDGGGFVSIEGAGTFGDFVAVAPAAGTSVQVKPDSDALTCKTLIIRFVDQTSPKEWEDQEVLVETYGHASAMHPFDLSTSVAAFVDAIWDELLAAHNIKKSAADYLKKGGGGSTVTLFAGTAQAGTLTNVTLATSAPAVANILQWNLIAITGGQGAGQTRRIVAYSASRVVTVDRAFVVAPNATSTYEVMAAAASVFANEGTVVAATSTTIQLATTAPTGDAALDGAMVTITGGPGAGETKILSNYDGATRSADVDSPWSETPTTASTYAVIPAAESASDTGGGSTAPTAAEVAAEVLAEMNATPPKASVAGYESGQAPLQPAVAGRTIAVAADGSVNAGSVTVEGDVTLAAEQPNYAPAKAGDAMTLTEDYDAAKTAAQASDIPSAAIAAIQAKTDNLPSDPADQSLIIAATNALASAITGIPAAVWASGTRTLTSFGSLVADLAAAVWASGTRTLSSYGSLVTDLATAVWTYVTRTLTTSSSGAGAITWTYTLTDSESGDPLSDVDVWVTTDLAGNNVIASAKTDQYGVVTFYLDAGTVYVWRQKTGWNFDNPDTEVVS